MKYAPAVPANSIRADTVIKIHAMIFATGDCLNCFILTVLSYLHFHFIASSPDNF